MTRQELKAIRTAVADYMRSEGCSCCQDYEAHHEHHARLGKLLKVQKYPDKSGYEARIPCGSCKHVHLGCCGHCQCKLPTLYSSAPQGEQGAMKTNRQLHEEAAGMGLCPEFFRLNGIDPDAKPGPEPSVLGGDEFQPTVSSIFGMSELTILPTGVDERATFEAWGLNDAPKQISAYFISRIFDGEKYGNLLVQTAWLAWQAAKASSLSQDEFAEYKADKDHLVRELDVIWNGEAGAAKQASLCDMVAQIRHDLPALRRQSSLPQESAEHHLRNLLAVIHRDGGHHADENGLKTSEEEAEKVVISLRSQVEELKLNLELSQFSKSPFCEHSSQYAYSPDDGKHIVCLLCKSEKSEAELSRVTAELRRSHE